MKPIWQPISLILTGIPLSLIDGTGLFESFFIGLCLGMMVFRGLIELKEGE